MTNAKRIVLLRLAHENLCLLRHNCSVVIAVAAICVMLAACGSSVPSESDAKQAYIAHSSSAQELANGTAVLTDFHKVNGRQFSGFGQKDYEMEFEAILKYPKGLNGVEPVGGSIKIHKYMEFKMTENGWEFDGIYERPAAV